MADPYIGQLTTFGGNFAPRGWAECDGQLLSISQYSSLFSILGTTYGGDGVSTFGLPDLRGRIALHAGQGAGLSYYRLGAKGGTETVTLTTNQISSHSHSYNANSATMASGTPQGNSLPTPGGKKTPYTANAPNTTMASGCVSNTGGGQSHNNLQPYLVLTRLIALEGVYPSRS